MRQVAFIYGPRFKEYDLGPSHPMRPARVERTYELIRACHLLEGENVLFSSPPVAEESRIALIHSPEYMEAVRSPDEGRPMPTPAEFGFGTSDNPIIRGMYDASALVAGASIQAADLVADGKVSAAFNPAGGLHHAHRARAAGFCVFNDVAIAIAHLRERCGDGVKIAYVDIDAHHGDGVQEAFYDCRDVLTISVHEWGRYLFPGTGYPEDLGEGEGEGFSVNLPLAPYTTDEVYLWAFREAVIPLLEAFEPDFVVSQLGADTHFRDPLTHMNLTTHGFAAVVDEIAARAPRWIATGGGGYDLTVVPRAWTLAFARMAEVEPPELIPESQAHLYRSSNDPPRLHDDEAPAVSEKKISAARHFAEEMVGELRGRVFPYHGLSAGE